MCLVEELTVIHLYQNFKCLFFLTIGCINQSGGFLWLQRAFFHALFYFVSVLISEMNLKSYWHYPFSVLCQKVSSQVILQKYFSILG